MKTHLIVIGALYTAVGGLILLGAVIAGVAIAGSGLISGDRTAITVTGAVSLFVAGLLAIIALPMIIGGIGLISCQPWSRVLVLVLGCVSLLGIPFGTILGIYTIWALTRPETAELMEEQKMLR